MTATASRFSEASGSPGGARYVKTADIQSAVRGHEADVLDTLGIGWRKGNPHIDCPYPSHGGARDWRWDDKAAKAYCTCIEGSDTVFNVVMKCEGVEFEDAKVRVAEIIGKPDLIRQKGDGKFQATDAASLLNVKPDARDDELAGAYLAHRLGIDRSGVVMPATPVAGHKALAYFDPPPQGSRQGTKPVLVGEFPCAVFGTVDAIGRRHAHRIYVAPGGAGKAELGNTKDGHPRDAKKSAKRIGDENTSGRSVIWGDINKAGRVVVTEGIETGAAVAYALAAEVADGKIAVAAAIAAVGVEAFMPWPDTQRVTIAADRDESQRPNGKAGSRRGEIAARKFGLLHYHAVAVDIALPGLPGQSIDWLDVLVTVGAAAVRAGIDGAERFEPTKQETEDQTARADREAELERVNRVYPLPVMNTVKLEYAITDGGEVWAHRWKPAKKDEPAYLSPVFTPFSVPARLRLADQDDSYGLRVVIADMDGEPREIDLDRANLARLGAAEIRAMLLKNGLRTADDGEAIAVACLKETNPEREIVAVRRTGWHDLPSISTDQIFVCPSGQVIGLPDAALELSINVRMPPAAALAGSLDGWKTAINAALAAPNCEHWGLGLFAAFAGPLISLTGMESCGMNISGRTSGGKTTAQRLAVSAWSKPSVQKGGLFQIAKATVNSVEAMAARANGTVLVMDELGHVSGKEISKTIYTLAGESGRVRMAADSSVRDPYTWKTFVFLSGESSLEEKVRSDGGEWKGGMPVRFPDIDIAGTNRGVEADTFKIMDGIHSNFGHAGPAFIEALVREGIHRKASVIKNGIDDFAGTLATEPSIRRAALPFATLAMAGILAQQFGLIPRSVDVSAIARWGWNRFMASTDVMVLTPEVHAVNALRMWIAERWNSSVRATVSDTGPPRDALAWYDDNAVYMPAHRLREAAGNTIKELDLARLLNAQGLIAKRKSADHLYVMFVPQIGKVKVYALSRKEFGRTNRDAEGDVLNVIPGGRA